MKLLLSTVVLFSATAFAGSVPGRQFMVCKGDKVNGTKSPVYVQFHVLNSKQVESLKIQFKNQVLVNEVNKVEGQAYNDGIINNHIAFEPKTHSELAVLLPVNFRMLKSTSAFLSVQKGDDISFTALTCVFQ